MTSNGDIPNEYLCPILLQLMEDPVMTEDGQTFDRSAIEQWFRTNTNKSPLTGARLSSTRLIPNFALKKLIEDYKQTHQLQDTAPATTTDQVPPPPAVPHSPPRPPPQVDLKVAIRDDDQSLAAVTVSLAGDIADCTVHLVVVLDVSGSMSFPSSRARPSSAAAGEDSSFSRLDLVKHSMNTAIEMLRAEDYLTIVKFSHDAECVLSKHQMTRIGKMIAKAKVEALYAQSTTNLWGGLWTGIQEVMKPMEQPFLESGGHGAILLMTDGCPSNDFLLASDIVRVLKTKLSRMTPSYPFAIHCCGYGQGTELDSAVLQDISTLGRGLFTYISDGMMVGTVFVHLVANLLSAALVDVRLAVHDRHSGRTEAERRVTYMRPGQPKTFFFERGVVKEATFTMTARGDTVRIVPSSATPCPNEPSPYVPFVAGLERLLSELKDGFHPITASAIIESVHQQLQSIATNNQSRHGQLFLGDWIYPEDPSKGQVARAVGSQAEWTRWGCHYLRALLSAHQQQEMTNFKDRSILAYATPRLMQLYETGYDTFAELEPPRSFCRTVTHAPRQTVSMRAMVNPSAGCFTGEARVTMEDGSVMKISDLRRGMKVKGVFVVDYLVVYHVSADLELCYATQEDTGSGFGVTPYHPFLHSTDGGAKEWAFPADHEPTTFQKRLTPNVPSLFNLVLTSGHVVEIEGLEYVTLGHGLTMNSVVAHPYFGTHCVVDDVKRMDVGDSGVAVFRRPVFIRDCSDGIVIGIVDV